MRTSHNISRAMLRPAIPLLTGLAPVYSLHEVSQYRPQGCFTLLFIVAMLAYHSFLARIDPWSVITIYTSALRQGNIVPYWQCDQLPLITLIFRFSLITVRSCQTKHHLIPLRSNYSVHIAYLYSNKLNTLPPSHGDSLLTGPTARKIREMN